MDFNDRFVEPEFDDHNLPSLPLLQGLTPGEIKKAQGVLHRKFIPAGQILLSEDQPGEIVYLLAEGAVRICVQRGGHDVIIGLHGRGDILGELSVIDGAARSATVIAQTSCLVYRVSHADFWSVLWEIKPFSRNLMRLMALRVRTLTTQLEAMASLSVQGRLAREIWNLAHEHGCPVQHETTCEAIEIPFRLTQGDLANMIGATRVQINQVFCQWKRRNLIELRDNHLVVLDREAIRALIV